MTQDVRPWLSEIQALQEKLAAAHQERDEAYASAANWRRLYECEANQRRTEASLAQQTIGNLKTQLQQMQTLPSETETDNTALLEELQQELKPLQRSDDLKAALLKALMECDRMARLLQAEQNAHAQTRKTLTAALGDTVQMLSKERSVRHPQPTSANMALVSAPTSTPRLATATIDAASPTVSVPPVPLTTTTAEARIPLLELPPIE
jgi:chromosome segregation ATPase